MVSQRLSPIFTWRSAVADSDLPSTHKLVALVLSLHMTERGERAFPKNGTLARETSLGTTAVRTALASLTEDGWLLRDNTPRGPGMAVIYAAQIPAKSPTPGVTSHAQSPTPEEGVGQHLASQGQHLTSERATPGDITPLNKTLEQDLEHVATPAKNRDEPFEVLCEVAEGSDYREISDAVRGSVNKALSILRRVPDASSPTALAQEIRRRADNWPTHFDATISAAAIAKHWARLDRPGPRGTRMPSPAEQRLARATRSAGPDRPALQEENR